MPSIYIHDFVLAGFVLCVCALLARTRVTWWTVAAAGTAVMVAAAGWFVPLSPGQIGRLIPGFVALWVIPGFLVLELVFRRLACQFDSLERAPLIFALSLTVWAAVAAVGYRSAAYSDAVLATLLVAEAAALVMLARLMRGAVARDVVPHRVEGAGSAKPYLAMLGVLVAGVSLVVGVTSRFQRNDFDAVWHLIGYNKVALGDRLLAVNPHLGPPFPYMDNYLANPGYLAFGLTARLAGADVIWFYVCLAVPLTVLFFLAIYAIVKAVLRSRWIGAVACLLLIGPWITEMALMWGPGFGTFALQFLPAPGSYMHWVLFPSWLACLFRYAWCGHRSHGALAVTVGAGAMAAHPDALIAVPFSAALVTMAILLGHRSREARITALAFGSSVVVLAGAIGYHVSHPPGEASWAGVGYAFFPEIYMKTLLRNALILSPERYAIHPRTLLEPNHLAFFAGTIALIVILAVPKLRRFWNVSATGDSPNRALAIAMGAIAIGPFLLACNPLIVPQLVQILGTAIPIPRIPGQYESLMLAAQFGAAAAALWAVARFVRNVRYGNAIAVLLTLAVVCATIVMPFNRPRARAILTRLAAGQNPDMLRLTGLPLFSGLARLPPGIVAIGLPDSESVLMTTPHYVVASTRMTEERQRDSNTIVRFAVPPERMRELVAQHRVDYVVVPLGSNILINGQFSGDTEPWYTPPTFSTIAIVAGGEMGTCLQLTRIEYPAQFATQNVPLEPGQAYRLEGYVKSGSSGDETFAIQMYGANVSGTAPVAAVTGRTTASWVKHSVTFTAAATELSVVLRKISETAGTMLFDSATLVPLESALDRFRRSEIFEEIFTTAEHAVFRVRKN